MPKLIEVLEFFDNHGNTMVKRLPENDNAEIKWGAQLTVRESQKAIFFKDGKAFKPFDAGRYVLDTKNIPVLTKLVTGLAYGKESPFRAEVYFLNMKLFRNFKWGTREPILFRDTEFEMIRLRANGNFSIQINDPKLFLNHVAGTQGVFNDSEITDYLRSITVSRITNIFADSLDTIFNLPKKFNDLGKLIKQDLETEFNGLGLTLYDFHVGSISVPPEVQKLIDTKSGMAAIGDLNNFLKFKTAQSIEKAAENSGTSSEGLGAGVGLGMGMAMPKMIQDNFTDSNEDAFGKIKKLKELLDINAISQEEFDQTKNKLLNNL